jgi:hypothetical protein
MTQGMFLGASFGLSPAQVAQVALTYGYVAFWIVASAGVILYNKWILTVWGFDYPITLTMWHMAFCSFVSAVLVRAAIVSRMRGTLLALSAASKLRLRHALLVGENWRGRGREHNAAVVPERCAANR